MRKTHHGFFRSHALATLFACSCLALTANTALDILPSGPEEMSYDVNADTVQPTTPLRRDLPAAA